MKSIYQIPEGARIPILQAAILSVRPRNRKGWIRRGFNIMRRRGTMQSYWETRCVHDKKADLIIEGLAQSYLKKSPPPAITKQFKSFVGSMATFAANGFQVVSQDQLAARLEVCRSCQKWDANAFAGTGRCLMCGCSTQAKLRMAHEKCPDGRWGSISG